MVWIVCSDLSLDDSAPPDLVDSSSDSGGPPDLDTQETTDESDHEEPSGRLPGITTWVDHLGQHSAFEGAARDLGRAAAQVAAARSHGASPSRERDAHASHIWRAAHMVVRWNVFLAVSREVVAGNSELHLVRHRIWAMARSGALIRDIEQVEMLEVGLINRLHSKAIALVDGLLSLRRAGHTAWSDREEARIQGASQSKVPCPCHYAAGKEAGPHDLGDKDMQCGCCAGTCEQCRPELDPRRPCQGGAL